jgi:hypothetical protein
MTTFRAWATKVLAPPRLRRSKGIRLIYGVGLVFDVMSQAVLEAVKARFASTGPVDALPYMGTERGIARGPSETEASYRERLRTAWSAWSSAGEAACILAQLAIYGVTAKMYGNHEILTEYPKDLDNWSRFWLIIEIQQFPWGSGPPDAAAQADISRIVRQWKPAHWICPSVGVSYKDDMVTWQTVQDMGLTWGALESKVTSGLPRETWSTEATLEFTP